MKKLVILPMLAIFISALVLVDFSISYAKATQSKVWNLKFNDWAQPNIPWGERNIKGLGCWTWRNWGDGPPRAWALARIELSNYPQ